MLGTYLLIALLPNLTYSLELLLQPTDPPQSTQPYDIDDNTSLRIRCDRGKSSEKLQWLHRGKEISSAEIVEETESSIVVIDAFNTHLHEGVYECYTSTSSAQVRLIGRAEPIVPDNGSRFCEKDENSKCHHALACFVDSTEHVYCKCNNGWQGEQCDRPVQPRTQFSHTDPDCPSYPGPLIVLAIGFLMIIGVLLMFVKWHLTPKEGDNNGDSKRYTAVASAETAVPV